MTNPTPPQAKDKPVVQTNPAVDNMRKLIEQYRSHITALVPKHLDAERVFNVARMAFGRNPKLAECTVASVLGGAIESARLGLEFGAGAGETWAVPFKNKHTGKMECQLIVDYRALIKLMKKGANVGAILVEPIHERDVFDYGIHDGKMTANWHIARGDRGPILGYFAATWDKQSQMTAMVYRTMEEIEKNHRGKSKAADSGPWAKKGSGDYDGMCRKTMARLVAKFNPYSTGDVLRAVELDERVELGHAQDLALLADPTETATPQEEGKKEEVYGVPEMKPEAAAGAPAKKEESAKPKEEAPKPSATYKVARVAKTTMGKASVLVIVAEDKTEYYLDDNEAGQQKAEAARFAKEEGKAVTSKYDEVAGKRWAATVELA